MEFDLFDMIVRAIGWFYAGLLVAKLVGWLWRQGDAREAEPPPPPGPVELPCHRRSRN